MKRARVIVLAIAITAAIAAARIAWSIVSSEAEVQQVEKTVGATDVLVAARDINLGDSVRSDDFKWQWPVEGVTPGLITTDAQPDAPSDLSGAVARAPFIAAEPIKELKLIKISEGGVMAAILPSGMCAVSTPIREETAAGGFILPNDRVRRPALPPLAAGRDATAGRAAQRCLEEIRRWRQHGLQVVSHRPSASGT
jgi:pilus assembly protein CpaB